MNQPIDYMHHSTATTVLCAHNDMIEVIDKGRVGDLMTLDLSAAYDTVDHAKLARVLSSRFGIEGRRHNCLINYLSNRTQFIH